MYTGEVPRSKTVPAKVCAVRVLYAEISVVLCPPSCAPCQLVRTFRCYIEVQRGNNGAADAPAAYITQTDLFAASIPPQPSMAEVMERSGSSGQWHGITAVLAVRQQRTDTCSQTTLVTRPRKRRAPCSTSSRCTQMSECPATKTTMRRMACVLPAMASTMSMSRR